MAHPLNKLFIFLFFLIYALFQPTFLAGAQGAEEQVAPFQLQGEVEVSPVIVDGLELFKIRGIRSYPAERRAREIQDRIVEIAKDPKITLDSLQQVPETTMIRIVAEDKIILSVFDADAKLDGISRATLAEAYLRVIRDAVANYRLERQPERLRRGIYLSLATTLILIFILLFFKFIFGRIRRGVKRKVEKAPEELIKIRGLEIIEANRFWKGIAGLFSGFRLLLTLGILYFYLQYVLGQFPWSRFIATQLLELVIRPLRTIGHSIVDYIPNFIFLLVLAGVVYLLLKFVKTFFGSIERKAFSLPSFEAEWARPTYRILRMLIVIFSIVVAYPYIPGSDSAAFKGVSIFVGILFSLGSSSAIANIIAGYSLIYRRSFKVGDRVQVGDIVGDVMEMRLQVTHLLTVKNEAVTVPNSLILNSHVINYTVLEKTQGLILHTNVSIGYEVPWRQVEALLIRAAQKTPGVLQEPPPFVLKKGLGDYSVNYEVNAYCEDSHRMDKVYNELHSNILDEFNEYGVAIMTPSYEADPQTPKLVPKENWFNPPAIKPTDKNND